MCKLYYFCISCLIFLSAEFRRNRIVLKKCVVTNTSGACTMFLLKCVILLLDGKHSKIQVVTILIGSPENATMQHRDPYYCGLFRYFCIIRLSELTNDTHTMLAVDVIY